jgi:UDP-glucose 4-epimerase
VDELLGLGHEVIGLDDLSGGFRDNVPPGAAFVEGSICDDGLVQDLFAARHFDYVFHLAAYAAEGLSHFIRRFNYTNNLLGSVNLINASIAHEVKGFVFTSSIAVYGASQVPMTEAMAPRPDDPYGVAKLAVEHDLAAARAMFGLNYIVFRPHNVYGERQNIGDRYRNVIGIFMNRLLRGESVPVFGDGEQTRAFTYVKDVSPIIARSIEVPTAYGEVFNVGADTPYSINALVAAVGEAMGTRPTVEYADARHEVRHAYSSHEKARRILGFEPRWDLGSGLARMATWVKRVGSRSSASFGAIELDRNLPRVWRDEPRPRSAAEPLPRLPS